MSFGSWFFPLPRQRLGFLRTIANAFGLSSSGFPAHFAIITAEDIRALLCAGVTAYNPDPVIQENRFISSMAIKILIADDHDVVRAGLKAMLEKSDIRIVAEASGGVAAYKLAKKHRPNLVLLDVRMPEGDGLTCLARLRLDLPDIPVLMFSGFDNPTYIARSVALGAAGFF